MADTQELKNLVHNILSIDGLPSTTYKKANKIHLGIVMLAILGGLIVLIEMVLNYNGIRSTQIYIGLLLNIVLIFYFTRPKLLPLMYIKKARFVIAHILLFCTTMSLLLYVTSIRSNPHMVPALFLLGLAVIYIDCVYNINSKTYKRLTILLVYATAILTFIAIPSRATYMKWIGVYPLEVIYTSDLEESVSELETLQNKVDQSSKKSRIDYFIWKIKEGKTLDENEKTEYKKIKEDLKQGKIPTAVKTAIDKGNDTADKIKLITEKAKLEAENAALRAAAAKKAAEEEAAKLRATEQKATAFPLSTKPGQEFFIPLQPNEELNVDKLKKGDRWEYPEANGEFAQRLYKRKGTCWGTMKKPDNWTADWDGTLQVKNLTGYPITVHMVRL